MFCCYTWCLSRHDMTSFPDDLSCSKDNTADCSLKHAPFILVIFKLGIYIHCRDEHRKIPQCSI